MTASFNEENEENPWVSEEDNKGTRMQVISESAFTHLGTYYTYRVSVQVLFLSAFNAMGCQVLLN